MEGRAYSLLGVLIIIKKKKSPVLLQLSQRIPKTAQAAYGQSAIVAAQYGEKH